MRFADGEIVFAVVPAAQVTQFMVNCSTSRTPADVTTLGVGDAALCLLETRFPAHAVLMDYPLVSLPEARAMIQDAADTEPETAGLWARFLSFFGGS